MTVLSNVHCTENHSKNFIFNVDLLSLGCSSIIRYNMIDKSLTRNKLFGYLRQYIVRQSLRNQKIGNLRRRQELKRSRSDELPPPPPWNVAERRWKGVPVTPKSHLPAMGHSGSELNGRSNSHGQTRQRISGGDNCVGSDANRRANGSEPPFSSVVVSGRPGYRR